MALNVEKPSKFEMIAIPVVCVVIGALIYSGFYFQSPSSVQNKNNAIIIVSLYYGKETLLKKEVKSGQSVLDALKAVANVSTSYGGAFVNGINGIYSDSQKKMDWFYYVNGILANVGAASYILQGGDVVRWDYHHWTSFDMLNAELADFPSMFTNGYGGTVYPTIIVYNQSLYDTAFELKKYLADSGAKVTLKNSSALTSEELKYCNIISVGTTSFGTALNSMWRDLHWAYHIENGTVVNANGTFLTGAFAEVAQSPYNPNGTYACQNVVMLIDGDDSYIKNCVSVLLSGNITSFEVFVGVE